MAEAAPTLSASSARLSQVRPAILRLRHAGGRYKKKKKKRHFQTFQEGELSLSTGAKPFCRWTGTGALRIEMRKVW